MDISVCVLAYNDEERIRQFLDSVKGIEDVVVSLDDKTTDKTGKIAKKMGARVVGRTDFWESPTQKNVKDFKKRFGFEPEFTTGNKYCQWSDVRNEAMSYCKNDWVFFPDSDEIVTWDLPEVEKLLFANDQIEYKFVNSHGPEVSFTHSKLFRKSRNKWVGDVHEVIVPRMMGAYNKVFTDKIRLDHYKANRPYRNGFLPRMEFDFIKNGSARTLFYLAREYYYHERYKEAVQIFDEYLKYATWQPEIAEAYYFKAQCLWQLQRGDEARKTCYEAVHLNPDFKRALLLISEMHHEPWKSKWKFIAENATNKDVLFG